MVFLGMMQRVQQDFQAALDTLSSALAIYRAANQHYVVIDILSQIARVRREQGLLHETARLCQEALAVADHYAKGVGAPASNSRVHHGDFRASLL